MPVWVQDSLSRNDLSQLEYVHGTTSGLKARCSTLASEGLEVRAVAERGRSRIVGHILGPARQSSSLLPDLPKVLRRARLFPLLGLAGFLSGLRARVHI
jgi:hypothetical protein